MQVIKRPESECVRSDIVFGSVFMSIRALNDPKERNSENVCIKTLHCNFKVWKNSHSRHVAEKYLQRMINGPSTHRTHEWPFDPGIVFGHPPFSRAHKELKLLIKIRQH